MHISDAQAGFGNTLNDNGVPITGILNRSRRIPGNWYDYFSPCNDRGSFAGPSTCDEYPYASTFQGGPLFYGLDMVSLKVVPRSEQNPQRDLINRFYTVAGIARLEENPEASIFLTYGLAGESWCTDRAGNVHDGCY